MLHLLPMPTRVFRAWYENLGRGVGRGQSTNSRYFGSRRPLTSIFEVLDRLEGFESLLLEWISDSIYFLYLLIYPKDDISAWSEVWATSSPPIFTFPVTGRGCGRKILGTSAKRWF